MRSTTYSLVACLILFAGGCTKKVAATHPSPAPKAPVARNEAPAPNPVKNISTPQPAAVRPPEQTPSPSPAPSFSDVIASRLKDIHFDYDRSTIRTSDEPVLAADANTLRGILRDYPNGKVLVEGDCDERGSAEYNMALGDERARAAREYLTHLGVPPARIDVVSYGKEHPVCTEETEACWTQNRRAHFRAE